MTNSFSTFEYDKAADYLPAFDRRVREEERGQQLVEAQMRDNDRQREANAKLFGRAINSVYDLSPKLAKLYKDRRDAKDIEHRNTSRRLIREARKYGINVDLKGQTEFKEQDREHNLADNFYQAQAYKAETLAQEPGADTEALLSLANDLRNITGRQAVIADRVLVQNAAKDFSIDYKTALDKGFSTTTEEGVELNASTIDPLHRRTLREAYMDKVGLSKVSHINPHFLEKHYWPEVTRQEKLLDSANSTNFTVRSTELRLNNDKVQLEAANSGEELFNAFVDIVQKNPADYGGTTEQLDRARAGVHEKIIDLVKSEDIPLSTYEAFLNHPFEQKGTKHKTTPKKLWKVLNNPTTSIDEIKQALLTKKTGDDKEYGEGLAFDFARMIEERGGVHYEDDIEKFEEAWNRDPRTKNQPLPESFKKLAASTVEDGNDTEIITFLKAQLEDVTVTPDINLAYLIQDDTKRAAMIKRIQGPEGAGLSADDVKKVRTYLTQAVKEELNLELGEAGNSTDVLEQVDSALFNYLKYYREGLNEYESPRANHQQALDAVKREIDDGIHNEPQSGIDTSLKYSKKINSIGSFIIKNPDDYLSKRLPGMDAEYAALEEWAGNPKRKKLPGIWHVLATRFPQRIRIDQGTYTLNGIDWAEENYRNVTGKNLPPHPLSSKIRNNPKIWAFLNIPSEQNKMGSEYESDTAETTYPGVLQ